MHAIHLFFVVSSLVAVEQPGSGSESGDSRAAGKVAATYSKDVAPILFRRCVQCHRPGEVAPFSLTSYESTVKWSETIREVVEQRRMPVWLANPAHGSFANAARLTDEEVATIVGWIDSGTPEGNPKDLPALPKFTEGWRIPKPDIVLEMPQTFTVPAQGTVNYQYFSVDPGLKEDTWVTAAEARPGNRSVVHHIVLLVQAPNDRPVRETGGLGSELLATFAPGLPPTVFTDGKAKLIPAGSKLILQVHYTPNGTEQTDRSRVGLVIADPQSVRQRVRGAFALNFQFKIPPGADNHPVEANYKFPQDTLIVALFPHMHLRGKSFQFEARYPDGKSEILLDVPRWDFSWQNQYVLSEPKRMPEGTVMHCTAYFDNSAGNPANPDSTAAVMFGEQTWEEMMVAYFDATLADQDLSAGGPQAKKQAGGDYEVLFRFKPKEPAKTVYLAGTFNEWKKDTLAMQGPDKDGLFTTRMNLPPGQHEYKFLIDGTKWRQDPGNYRQSGGYSNSLLVLAGDTAASPPLTHCKPIDLQPVANQELKKEFGEVEDGNSLSELATGDQVLSRVPFAIGPRLIALGSAIKENKPKRVEGVKVGMRFTKLHILHATEYGASAEGDPRHVADGTQIGSYTIHFEDKSTATVPIIYGEDVRDWWFSDRSPDTTRGKVAWQGTNSMAKDFGAKVRLYMTTWSNPKPGVAVTHIDFSSGDSASAPFCVAMSVQTE